MGGRNLIIKLRNFLKFRKNKYMIQPIGKHVVVRVLPDEEKKEGKFVIAEGARKDKPLKVELTHDTGQLKKGDVLYVQSYGYTEIEDVLVVPIDMVLCRIMKGE